MAVVFFLVGWVIGHLQARSYYKEKLMETREEKGTGMSLYDDFIKSIEETSAEELRRDIEKAEKDSKNSYLLDESIERRQSMKKCNNKVYICENCAGDPFGRYIVVREPAKPINIDELHVLLKDIKQKNLKIDLNQNGEA